MGVINFEFLALDMAVHSNVWVHTVCLHVMILTALRSTLWCTCLLHKDH